MVRGSELFFMTKLYRFLVGTVQYTPNRIVRDGFENLVPNIIIGHILIFQPVMLSDVLIAPEMVVGAYNRLLLLNG